MEFFWMRFCRPVALALFGDAVNEHWVIELLAVFKHTNELVYIMTIDRPQILDAQFFKEITQNKHMLHAVFKAIGNIRHLRANVWNALEHIFHIFLHAVVAWVRTHTGEVLAHPTNIWIDAHFVVV